MFSVDSFQFFLHLVNMCSIIAQNLRSETLEYSFAYWLTLTTSGIMGQNILCQLLWYFTLHDILRILNGQDQNYQLLKRDAKSLNLQTKVKP